VLGTVVGGAANRVKTITEGLRLLCRHRPEAVNDGNPPKIKRDVVSYDFNGGKGYTVVNAILIGYGAESGAVH
jgi:hypothetical protein